MKLATLLLFLIAASLSAAEPLFEKTDVFPPGLNGIARYRIPGIVVTPKGTVLAYAEARKNNSSDWGEIEIHLRRSTDGGKTWEDAKQIAHHGARLDGNPRKAEGGDENARRRCRPAASALWQSRCCSNQHPAVGTRDNGLF